MVTLFHKISFAQLVLNLVKIVLILQLIAQNVIQL